MSELPGMKANEWVRIGIIGIVLLVVTTVFLNMISGFLLALLLAAIFSAMAMPFYEFVLRCVGGRKAAASGLTMLILILAVMLPGLYLIALIASQAANLGINFEAGAHAIISSLNKFDLTLPEWFPFREQIESLGPQIITKIAGFAGRIGQFFLSSLATFTKETAQFFLQLFVLLYAMFFFLKDGRDLMAKSLSKTTLNAESQQKILYQGYLAARATIKGAIVIGTVQGFLGGLGFWITGIPNAALWGLVMAIASLMPGIGTAIVWIPGVIYLFAIGKTMPAVGLTVWSMLLVGSIDNLLRPKLVGGDAKMSDLVILVSTFGGLATFGASGLILGPAIAAVFFTMWDLFAEANKPMPAPAPKDEGVEKSAPA